MDLQTHSLFQPSQANGRVATNKYMEILPTPLLNSYVSCYWFSEPVTETPQQDSSRSLASLREGSVDRVLPDGCSDIIFEHDLKRNKCRTLFCGFMDEPFTITYDQHYPLRKFGVRFFPGGVFSMLGIPQQDFANAHVDLDLVWPSITRDIEARMFEEPSFEKKAKIMDEYLLSCIRIRETANDNLLNNLLYHVFATEGKTTVRELAEREAISARQMNRLFYRWIGTSPKRFCEVVRFQTVINVIQSSTVIDRTLAFNHGYFDQAHMIRDFKRFYGDSPSVAIREFGTMSDFYNKKIHQFITMEI
ncbi:MAG TPA: helix-turn-helix domain-containing protein [Paenibacillus sp.]|nr:helix-turn-helix domain-containing protein [Paenibacillus sp.]